MPLAGSPGKSRKSFPDDIVIASLGESRKMPLADPGDSRIRAPDDTDIASLGVFGRLSATT